MSRLFRTLAVWILTISMSSAAVEVLQLKAEAAGPHLVPDHDSMMTTGPGRVEPATTPPAQALIVDWGGDNRSLLVVGRGQDITVPAWVVTYDEGGVRFAVAYAGRAFLDAEDVLHFDCRFAVLSGPSRDQWWPDSFAIDHDGTVRILDDADNPGLGTVSHHHPAETQAARYRDLLDQGRFFVERFL